MTHLDDTSEADWLALVQEAASLPSAPSVAVRTALELWRDHAPTAPLAAGGRVRRWIAALTFDSWATPATDAGIRGVATEARHLLFAAAGRDIDLRIAPTTAGFVVNGQHLGPASKTKNAGPAAWSPLGESSHAQQRIELTPNGEFCIEGVEPGTYRLELTFGDEDVVLAPIVVGEPSHDP